jgi:hypothetical protein
MMLIDKIPSRTRKAEIRPRKNPNHRAATTAGLQYKTQECLQRYARETLIPWVQGHDTPRFNPKHDSTSPSNDCPRPSQLVRRSFVHP